MSKKGENIYKRKDGRWEGRYIKFYDGEGKAKYGYLYGKTYSEVKTRLRDVQADLKYGVLPKLKATPLCSEILVAWLQSTRINVKESTYMRYKQLIDISLIAENSDSDLIIFAERQITAHKFLDTIYSCCTE